MKAEENRELLVVMFLIALYNGQYRKLVTHFISYMHVDGNETKTLANFVQAQDDSVNEPTIWLLKHELDVALTDHVSYRILQNEIMATFKNHHQFIQRFTFDEM